MQWQSLLLLFFILAVGSGDGKDLSFDIIINGSPIYQMELLNARPGKVLKSHLPVYQKETDK